MVWTTGFGSGQQLDEIARQTTKDAAIYIKISRNTINSIFGTIRKKIIERDQEYSLYQILLKILR